jgi:hypothetical protein
MHTTLLLLLCVGVMDDDVGQKLALTNHSTQIVIHHFITKTRTGLTQY